ncbi:hypothetical protein NDU88_008084 [Pleurodeles waltl]|uniref:Uncharacterized protein n=1 Tax=Pleurodeles waltl TaxID=8319 RepID=A0AAV7N601_PLEWA|nr:hypothetical protein NDU88_008084 [Pleurodeles waltl]
MKGNDINVSQKLGIEELTEEQDAPNRKDTPPGLENPNGRRQGEYDCGAEDTRIFERSRPSERPVVEERNAQVTSRQPRNEEPSALR